MDFIVNDCSLHEQFPASDSFVESLKRLLLLRNRIERSSRAVRCSRKLLDAKLSPNMTVRQALALVDRKLRIDVVTWLANKGPFWDDSPLHGPDDWFELENGDIVTETGIGEAAMATLGGLPRALLSFDPSNWLVTPIKVDHVRDASTRKTIVLQNHWSLPSVEQCLHDTRPGLASWESLVQWAREECPRIVLTRDVIRWLDGHNFDFGAAKRFQVLLKVLDTIRGSFDANGNLSDAGMHLLQSHFVGKKAWFSDSSDAEKNDFQDELTFPDPERTGATIFCPWHGKVKTGHQMRLHFTYPIRHDRPLYVVYIGPKLTKR